MSEVKKISYGCMRRVWVWIARNDRKKHDGGKWNIYKKQKFKGNIPGEISI